MGFEGSEHSGTLPALRGELSGGRRIQQLVELFLGERGLRETVAELVVGFPHAKSFVNRSPRSSLHGMFDGSLPEDELRTVSPHGILHGVNAHLQPACIGRAQLIEVLVRAADKPYPVSQQAERVDICLVRVNVGKAATLLVIEFPSPSLSE